MAGTGGRVSVRRGVMSRDVDGLAVLLDAQTGRYFQLDEIGARAWSLVTDGRSLEGIVAVLASEYDADASTITRDIEALLARLEAAGLIEYSRDGD